MIEVPDVHGRYRSKCMTAREALSKINAVAKMVINGMPKPSVTATATVVQPMLPALPRPVRPKPARPVRRRQLPPPPLVDADVDVDENLELEEEAPHTGEGGEQETGEVEAGEQSDGEPSDEERAEWDAVSAEDVSPSEEDIEFGAALGWVANQFVSVDGSQWTWTGQSSTNDIEGEVRVLRNNRGKDLPVSQGELLELIKEGELTPIKGTEIAGSDPRADLMIASLGAVSAKKRVVLQQRRAAAPATRGTPMGRGAPAKGGTPMGRGTPAKGGAPAGRRGGVPTGRAAPAGKTGSPIGLRNMPTGATTTSSTPAKAPFARAAVSNVARAAVVPPILAAATPASVVPPTMRIPGMLYPGDPGYPLMPGMPGYGTPLAGSAFAGLPQGFQGDPGGGGGGGGGGDMPDEGSGGGGDEGGEWGGDSPDDFEESLPHDADGNVTFPAEGDTADGAEYPEEKSQSSDADAGAGADDEGPDVFPDEGAQPGGRG